MTDLTPPTSVFNVREVPARDEVIRIDAEGFHYLGQFIADAGEAYQLLVEFLRKQRQAPQPVSVHERPPGPEDCDAEGRCWMHGKVEGDWRLINPANSGVPQLKYCFTHWLPAHALPLPGDADDPA